MNEYKHKCEPKGFIKNRHVKGNTYRPGMPHRRYLPMKKKILLTANKTACLYDPYKL